MVLPVFAVYLFFCVQKKSCQQLIASNDSDIFSKVGV